MTAAQATPTVEPATGPPARSDRRLRAACASRSSATSSPTSSSTAEIARVSREAPVLILDYDSTEIVPGGAGNAANNVAALGGARGGVGVVGRDEPGDRLLEALRRARRTCAAWCGRAGYRTPVKTRILAGGIHSAKQQVVRIDRGTRPSLSTRTGARVEVAARRGVRARRRGARLRLRHAAWSRRPLVRARQRRGSRRAEARAAGARRLALRAARVSRHDRLHAERVRGRAAARRAHRRRTRACSSGPAATLLERTRMPRRARSRAAAAAWRSSSRTGRPMHIPIFGSDQIADVTGAGDTVIATMTLALAAGRVVRRGRAPGQLRRRARGDEARHGDRVSADELRRAVRVRS